MGLPSEMGSWLPIEPVLLKTRDIADPLPVMSPLSS